MTSRTRTESKSSLLNQRYEVLSLLGEGGMGEVRLVKDRLANGEPLRALKTLKETALQGEDLLSWFKQEFKALTGLRHPGLARVYDFGRDQSSGKAFFTSDYVQGFGLAEYAKGVDLSRRLQVLQRIGQALEYIHSRGILHNDLKISNILVERRTRQPKILDFGLSRLMTETQVSDGASFAGTWAYASPERLRGGAPSVQSDLYAFGMIAYRLLTDQVPYADRAPSERLRLQMAGKIPEPHTVNAHLPVPVSVWILSLLEPDLQRRPATVAEALETLRTLMGGQALALSEEELFSLTEATSLFGREPELDVLCAALQRPREGRSRPHLLQGPPGVGRTAVLEACRIKLQLEDQGVVARSARETRGAFSVWQDVLSEVRAMVPPDPNLSERLDSLIRSIGPTASGSLAEDHANQQAFFLQFMEALELTYRAQSYAILIDDLHQADQVSKDFFRYYSAQVSKGIVKSAPPILASSLSGSLPEMDAEIVTLKPLTKRDCESWLQGLLRPAAVSKELLSSIFDWTGGNPQHLTLMLRDFIRRHVLLRRGDTWAFDDGKFKRESRGKGIEDLFASTWTALAPEERSLLQKLSFWQGRFQEQIVAQLAGEDFSDLSSALARWLTQGILLQGEGSEFHFQQEAFATFVQKSVADPKPIHAELAKLLESAEGATAYQKAIHFVGAGNSAIATGWCLQAAKEAGAVCAFQEQERFLTWAELHARASGQRNLELDAKDRLALLHWNQGDRSESVSRYTALLQETATERSAEEESTDSIRFRAWRYSALAARDAGDMERADKLLREGISDLGRRGAALRADLLAQLALLSLRRGNLEEAKETLQRALSLVARQGVYQASAQPVLIVAGQVARQAGEFDRAEEYLQASLRLAEDRQENGRAALALNNLGTLASSRREYARARDYYTRAHEFAVKAGDVNRLQNSLYNLGTLAYLAGEYARSADHLMQAIGLARRIEDQKTLTSALTTLALLQSDRGLYAEAVECLNESEHLLRSVPNDRGSLYWTQASLHVNVLFGDLDAAARRIRVLSEGTIDPSFPLQASAAQAQIQLQREDFTTALATCREILQRKSEDSAQRFEVGLLQIEALLGLGQMDAASTEGDSLSRKMVSEFLRVSRQRWALLQLRIRLPHALQDDRRKNEWMKRARECLNEVIAGENPHLQLEAYRWIGEGFERLERPMDAVAFYEEGLRVLNRLSQTLPASAAERFRKKPHHRALADLASILARSTHFSMHRIAVLEAQLGRFQKLLQINRHLVSGFRDRQGLLQYIVDTALELAAAQRAMLVLKEDGRLQVVAAKGSSEGYSTSIVGQVMQEGRTVTLFDAGSEGGFLDSRSVIAQRIRSVVCVPLRREEGIAGVLYLDHDQKAGLFSTEEIDTLEGLADQASLVLGQSDSWMILQASADEVTQSLRRAEARLSKEAKDLERKYRYAELVGGKTPAMQAVFEILDRLRDSDATVLIRGESGTGKEMVARAIHQTGRRKDGPFVSINCAALTAELLESELFGHVKGAFTGAVADKEGLFVVAKGGTLFLDEIGDMPLEMQAKLLRVLEEREVRPVGGSQSVPIDVRILSATHQDLESLIREKVFREDLFYRLHVVEVEIPALRERLEDLPDLIDHFWKQAIKGKKRGAKSLTTQAKDVLTRYPWPGNVRELRHTLEAIATLSDRKRVDVAHLPPALLEGASRAESDLPDLETAKEEFYRTYLANVLRRSQGNYVEAAKRAGVYRESLHRLLKKYGLK